MASERKSAVIEVPRAELIVVASNPEDESGDEEDG